MRSRVLRKLLKNVNELSKKKTDGVCLSVSFTQFDARRGIFPQFGRFLSKNWSDRHENFVIDVYRPYIGAYLSKKEVPIKFRKSFRFGVGNTDSWSWPHSLWRRSALSKFSCSVFSMHGRKGSGHGDNKAIVGIQPIIMADWWWPHPAS